MIFDPSKEISYLSNKAPGNRFVLIPISLIGAMLFSYLQHYSIINCFHLRGGVNIVFTLNSKTD